MHAHAYTDSPTEAKNNEKLKYLSTKELADRVEEYNRTYNNLNMSGYILLPTGAALTIIGIPLLAFGNRIDLEIYMNNEISSPLTMIVRPSIAIELAKFCKIMHIFCICFKKNVLLHPISDNIEYVI